MSYLLNEKLIGLVPYEPISGNYSIRLDANESFLTLPISVMRAVSEAILHVDYNRYPDPAAVDLCQDFSRFYGLSPDLVTAGNGSDELIFLIMSAFLMKGDNILILSPDFSMYNFYSSLVESTSLVLLKGDAFSIDIDNIIQQAKEEKVKMIIFSNPCNPTSQGVPREEVERLIGSVDALVVVDEAYMDFWDQSLLPNVTNHDNLIILRTLSKAFGMAAIRLGFAVSAPPLQKVLMAAKSPYNVNAVTQAIGRVVLSHGEEMRAAIGKIVQSRDWLYALCKAVESEFPDQITVYPPCTNFVTIRTKQAGYIYDALLKEGIVVRGFSSFLRVTCGKEEENETFIKALTMILKGM